MFVIYGSAAETIIDFFRFPLCGSCRVGNTNRNRFEYIYTRNCFLCVENHLYEMFCKYFECVSVCMLLVCVCMAYLTCVQNHWQLPAMQTKSNFICSFSRYVKNNTHNLLTVENEQQAHTHNYKMYISGSAFNVIILMEMRDFFFFFILRTQNDLLADKFL